MIPIFAWRTPPPQKGEKITIFPRTFMNVATVKETLSFPYYHGNTVINLARAVTASSTNGSNSKVLHRQKVLHTEAIYFRLRANDAVVALKTMMDGMAWNLTVKRERSECWQLKKLVCIVVLSTDVAVLQFRNSLRKIDYFQDFISSQ